MLANTQCIIGVGGACAWAAQSTHAEGGWAQPAAVALIQAHLAAWLLAAVTLSATYALVPTAPPPTEANATRIAPEDDAASAPSALMPNPRGGRATDGPAGRGAASTLARPLLENGRPAA